MTVVLRRGDLDAQVYDFVEHCLPADCRECVQSSPGSREANVVRVACRCRLHRGRLDEDSDRMGYLPTGFGYIAAFDPGIDHKSIFWLSDDCS